MKILKSFFKHLKNQMYVPHFVIVFFIVFGGSPTQVVAQEIRTFGYLQALGEINGGFPGAGIGIENPFGKHFAMAADFSVSFQSLGTAMELKTAAHYYFRKDQQGLFLGPALKYISLDEKGENARYLDELYAVGFTVGIKSQIPKGPMLFIALNPHKTIGERDEGDVAGISGQLGLSFSL